MQLRIAKTDWETTIPYVEMIIDSVRHAMYRENGESRVLRLYECEPLAINSCSSGMSSVVSGSAVSVGVGVGAGAQEPNTQVIISNNVSKIINPSFAFVICLLLIIILFP
jgi:hypothetical protein